MRAIFSTARSVAGSTPTTSARISRLSASATVTSSCSIVTRRASPVTTWLLVRMNPSLLTITPEPRLFSTPRREPKSASGSPKSDPKNGSTGTCRRTTCCEEMLTTAGMIRSAMRLKSVSVARWRRDRHRVAIAGRLCAGA